MFDGIHGYPENKVSALQHIKKNNDKNIVMIGDGLDDREAADQTRLSFLSVGEGRGALIGEEIYSLDNILECIKNA